MKVDRVLIVFYNKIKFTMENRVWKFWCGLELPLSYSPWIIYELVSKYQFQLMSCYYLSKTVPWTLEYIKWSQPSQSRFLQVLFMISPLAPNNRHLGGMLASLRIYSIPLTHSMAPLASHPAHPHDWSFGKSFLTCPSHPFLFLPSHCHNHSWLFTRLFV
jgi:hypothetical protein